jgi:hypothetical protein
MSSKLTLTLEHEGALWHIMIYILWIISYESISRRCPRVSSLWCTEFMVLARTLLVTDLPGSSQHAITILPPPQIVHIKITINCFYKLYRVFII